MKSEGYRRIILRLLCTAAYSSVSLLHSDYKHKT